EPTGRGRDVGARVGVDARGRDRVRCHRVDVGRRRGRRHGLSGPPHDVRGADGAGVRSAGPGLGPPSL
ncbi:MAG: hypothetical protein AVDCRST_MAG49-2308, partial [uncultured Thermomicrobiales bacterium]